MIVGSETMTAVTGRATTGEIGTETETEIVIEIATPSVNANVGVADGDPAHPAAITIILGGHPVATMS